VRNPLKAKLAAGRTVFGTLLTIPSEQLACCVADAGLDWVGIDMEHGPIDAGAAHSMILATAGSTCAPLVRIPHDNLSTVRAVLDCGAFGAILPMARRPSDIALFQDYLRYPPLGKRGVGPIHACQRWGLSFADYLAVADEELTLFILVEDIASVDDLEAILNVGGIDAAIIAPFDLSASLGLGGQLDHPDVRAAIQRAEAAILNSGVALGGLARNADDLKLKLERGYRVMTLGYDVALLQGAITGLLNGIENPKCDRL
jgi:4-hydroxy-2-oxoheptanedioate aldolase